MFTKLYLLYQLYSLYQFEQEMTLFTSKTVRIKMRDPVLTNWIIHNWFAIFSKHLSTILKIIFLVVFVVCFYYICFILNHKTVSIASNYYIRVLILYRWCTPHSLTRPLYNFLLIVRRKTNDKLMEISKRLSLIFVMSLALQMRCQPQDEEGFYRKKRT